MKKTIQNTIEIFENGPIYFRGNIEIQDVEGNPAISKDKLALCRCGGSGNKPLCDGTHKSNDFSGSSTADTSRLPESAGGDEEKLILKPMKNGPVLVNGTYTLQNGNGVSHTSSKSIALCRCGGSSNKPFCDGDHKKNGFTASGG